MKKQVMLLLILFLIIYSATAIALEVKIKEEVSGAVKTYYTSGTAACVGKPACKTVKITDHATGQLGYIDCNKYIPPFLYAKANCYGGLKNSLIRDGSLMQNIYYNDGTSACSGKWGLACASINYGNDRTVPYNDNSACGWYFGSNFITAVCEASPVLYSCTGTTPANAALCIGDDTGLITDTARTTVTSCTTAKKCEYACNTGYTPSADKMNCVAACIPSYKNSCDNSDGCGNTRNPSPYNSCNLASAGVCGTETACTDSVDNNCNGESDYDSQDGRHGDSSCTIGVTGISVSNANPYVNTAITLLCTSTVANVNSVSATLGGSLCSYNSWSGNVVSFSCNTGASAGIKTATCYVDTAKSYKSGTDKSASVNVQTPACSRYTSSSTCPTATCDWCTQCSNPFSTGQTNACVTKGTCPARVCWKGQCGAACDNTQGGCLSGYACDASCGCIQTCKTSGACSSNSEACSGYWCSNNNVCQNQWKWTGATCEKASLCGGSCPWTPSQPEYWTHLNNCVRPSKACCEMNYGVETTDWCDVTEIK